MGEQRKKNAVKIDGIQDTMPRATGTAAKSAATRSPERGQALQHETEASSHGDHLVHVDTLITDPSKRVDFSAPDGTHRLARRANNIAIKAYEFLRKMKVPNDAMFSHSRYWTHKRIRVGVTDDIMQQRAQQQAEKVGRVDPKNASPHMEPVVVAGVAFYLDHETQQAYPVRPQKVEDDSWPVVDASAQQARSQQREKSGKMPLRGNMKAASSKLTSKNASSVVSRKGTISFESTPKVGPANEQSDLRGSNARAGDSQNGDSLLRIDSYQLQR